MRIVAVATLALVNFVTGGVTLYKEEEDRVNKFVRQTGRIKRTVLTQTEEMMMREEIFLESLASKLSRKQNAITVDRSDWVLKMKSFLQTFTNRPRLQTKGISTTQVFQAVFKHLSKCSAPSKQIQTNSFKGAIGLVNLELVLIENLLPYDGKGGVTPPKQINFRKSCKGGGGHFQSISRKLIPFGSVARPSSLVYVMISMR